MSASDPFAAPFELPSRKQSDHKGTYGRVLLVGGSRGMAGSIALSSIAALHSGTGLVAAAVPDRIVETVAGFHPAVMTLALPDQHGRFAIQAWQALQKLVAQQNVIGVGPGMTTCDGSIGIVDGLLNQRKTPLVFDADALNVIAQNGLFANDNFRRNSDDAPVVLTPHPGELARLTGVAADDPARQLAAAQDLANRMRMTIVVKGGPTRIVTGDFAGPCPAPYTNGTGNPAMATAGCGDVLTGVITSLLGQGLSGWDAARLGVWIHGRAGDEAAARTSQAGMTALHLVETLATIADEMSRKAMS